MTSGRKTSTIGKMAAFKKVEFYKKCWLFLACQNSIFDEIKKLVLDIENIQKNVIKIGSFVTG